MNKWTMSIFNFFDKVVNLAYVNLLWILFTLLGGIVFGIYPATTALLAIIRRWTVHRESMPVFKTFWEIYKTEFFKSNVIGFFIMSIGAILLIDIMFFKQIHPLLYMMFIMLFILYLLTCCFIIPMYVHYDLKLSDYFKKSFILIVTKPVSSILMIVILIFMTVSTFYLPGIIPFFSISVPAYFIMKLCVWTFNHIEKNRIITPTDK